METAPTAPKKAWYVRLLSVVLFLLGVYLGKVVAWDWYAKVFLAGPSSELPIWKNALTIALAGAWCLWVYRWERSEGRLREFDGIAGGMLASAAHWPPKDLEKARENLRAEWFSPGTGHGSQPSEFRGTPIGWWAVGFFGTSAIIVSFMAIIMLLDWAH